MRGCLLAFLLVPLVGFASDQWTEVKSPHFLVITDAGDKRGRDVALRFEQMRQVFGSLVLRGEVKTSRPVQILAFKSSKEMRQVAPLYKGKPIEVAGLYQKGQSQDYIALDLSTEGDYRWQTVFHEYAHLLLNSNTFAWPPWFDEGFAELFSTIDLSGKTALIGRSPESAAQMIVSNRLIPVAQLFAVRHDSPMYNENGDHRNMFYAESWLIVHYLEDKNLVKLVILSFAETHGLPNEQVFRKHVGMSFAEFDRALEEYVRGNRLVGWNTPLPTGLDAKSFDARLLTANDALVALAQMHANERDYQQEAIAELKQALAIDSNNIEAQSNLGYIYLIQHDYSHAEPYLEKAAATGSKDAMVHCYYAMLLQQRFQSASPGKEQLDRQRKELEEAISLNPSLAQAYNLLALNAHQRGDSAAAIEASLHAVALDQRNEFYALALANAYLTAQKTAEAESVLNQLRNSQNQQVLTAVASMQSYISQVQSSQQVTSEGSPVNVGPNGDGSISDTERASAPSVLVRKQGDSGIGTLKEIEGTLVQIDCRPDGSGTLYMQDGDSLVQLHFRSFSDITSGEAGAITCRSTNQQVRAEYTINGFVEKLSSRK